MQQRELQAITAVTEALERAAVVQHASTASTASNLLPEVRHASVKDLLFLLPLRNFMVVHSTRLVSLKNFCSESREKCPSPNASVFVLLY